MDAAQPRTSPRLTIGGAASRLGVAVETLRSWERRYGLGPHPRTPGAHRRYAPTDIARLESFCRLVGEGVAAPDAARAVLEEDAAGERAADTAAEADDGAAGEGSARAGGGRTLPVGRGGSAAARGLARSAMRMDTRQVSELLDDAFEREGVVGAWEEVIQPALLAVGRKWTETKGRYVEVEHLLSWCVSAALHRVPRARGGAAGHRVLLACAPDEWHSLPLEVLHAALCERAVPACMLGPAVPADALHEAVRRVRPTRVVVWSQSSRTGNPSALPPAASGAARCRILAAGPGWAGARPAVPGVLGTLSEALAACRP